MASTSTLSTAWFYSKLLLLGLLLVSYSSKDDDDDTVRGKQLMSRACDEIYVVGEGETLHTISDKCGDPFIVEQNPHIHDPDDVFPGLVIMITPFSNSRKNTS
ncbi:UNVERIFIED_CONTAM: hypothetical protein Slati_0359600 [Sesamum latifolium]|uniref:LysM domain-containing protein n=1 Tax=Sesamum latifolium TaxID=2727402 RepID=A0AAW2YG01_9LAMI